MGSFVAAVGWVDNGKSVAFSGKARFSDEENDCSKFPIKDQVASIQICWKELYMRSIFYTHMNIQHKSLRLIFIMGENCI